MRGTVSISALFECYDRFIPACAGNSYPQWRRPRPDPVHPRVCGEQNLGHLFTFVNPGSSPRVRGTDCSLRHKHQRRRFIPACAGNRTRPSGKKNSVAVHPRVCGEQSRVRSTDLRKSGSSPRVRGTGTGAQFTAPTLRFIPACAGNRVFLCRKTEALAVHPRVCGEQRSDIRVRASGRGSSPRVRGTVHRQRSPWRGSRFIPACAGNSCDRLFRCDGWSVHPRVCGEQYLCRMRLRQMLGSSPRVRGTDLMGRIRTDLARFIPACAGNSSYSQQI